MTERDRILKWLEYVPEDWLPIAIPMCCHETLCEYVEWLRKKIEPGDEPKSSD